MNNAALQAAGLRCGEGPPSVATHHDVVFHPAHRCLFSSDGHRIDSSCRPHKDPVDDVPSRITPLAQVPRVRQAVIYGGTLIAHYGHFLTESISRLWYAMENPSLPILYAEAPRDLIVAELDRSEWPSGPSMLDDTRSIGGQFLALSPLDRGRFMSFDTPVMLDEVVVPEPSITLNQSCFTVHRRLPEAVAERALGRRPEVTSQPLYLSRSRLTPATALRAVENEARLEDVLRRAGCAVVHPEELDLREQIRLINTHRTVIGVWGSALHSVLFDLTGQSHLVCISDRDRIDEQFLLIDAIKGVSSTYLAALDRDDAADTVRWKQRRSIDVDRVVSGLRHLGVV